MSEVVQKVKVVNSYANPAISLGEISGAALSYLKWHSVMWALVHGACWWFYVPYYLVLYGW